MLRNFLKNWKYDLIVFIIYAATFIFLITEFKKLDIKDHNSLLSEYLNSGYFPFPPGYYLLIFLLDLLIKVKYPFVAAAAIILTIFSWWKYRIVFSWLKDELEFKGLYVFLIALCLLFLSPLYVPSIDGEFWYLGKFTSLTWHNSTLIAVFPFCILLTFHTLSWFERDQIKTSGIILFLGMIILLVKPSFLFCFIPAFPIYTLISEKKMTVKVLTATGISVMLLAMVLVEKYLIFTWDPMIGQLYTSEEQSKVILAPMRVWLHFSDQPFFDFFSSFPLLISFLFLWKKEAFNSVFFSFSLIVLIFALLVYALFAETGFREFHGNFYWQIPIALFLNSLSIILYVGKNFSLKMVSAPFKYYFLFGIFLMQGIWGVFYWLRIFFGGTLS